MNLVATFRAGRISAAGLCACLLLAIAPNAGCRESPREAVAFKRQMVTEEFSTKPSADGRIVPDTLQVRKTEQFNRWGKVVERRYDLRDGTGETRLVLNYTETLALQSGDLYTPEGSLAVHYKYELDDRGNKSREMAFAPDGQPMGGTVYVNNADGHPEEFYFTSSDGRRQGTYYSAFNDEGLMVSTLFTDTTGASQGVLRFEYLAFDDRGEWTVRHVYFDGELGRIDRRQIEYH